MNREIAASPAVLALDGFEWRPVEEADATELEPVAAAANNREIHGLPEMGRFGPPNFRLPMVCHLDSSIVGAAATKNRNRRNLNLQLVCLFREPAQAATPLAMYIRHLFWLMPLHRVYAQMPVSEGSDAYGRLLQSVGFVAEGAAEGHAVIHGEPRDIAVYGLLRTEFEAWCRERQSRLLL